jgi:hypothetical protein
MANALYPKGKKKILDGDIDFLADDIKFLLIDLADYTYDAADEFVSDVAAGAIVARTAALSGKTTTDGTFDADDPTAAAVTGDPLEALILFKDTGADATSPLIGYIDTPAISFTPNGSGVIVNLDPLGIFSI